MTRSGRGNGLRNLLFAARTLHRRGVNNNGNFRCAPLERAHHIAQRGRGQARDNADGARVLGQRLFALGRKHALSLQFGLELFISFVKLAQAFEAHFVYRDLKFAARFVNADSAAQFDVVAFFQGRGQLGGGAFKHRAAHLGAAVFEREIIMAAGGAGEVGHFTGHPQAE